MIRPQHRKVGRSHGGGSPQATVSMSDRTASSTSSLHGSLPTPDHGRLAANGYLYSFDRQLSVPSHGPPDPPHVHASGGPCTIRDAQSCASLTASASGGTHTSNECFATSSKSVRYGQLHVTHRPGRVPDRHPHKPTSAAPMQTRSRATTRIRNGWRRASSIRSIPPAIHPPGKPTHHPPTTRASPRRRESAPPLRSPSARAGTPTRRCHPPRPPHR
jgi:hypothetical protein